MLARRCLVRDAERLELLAGLGRDHSCRWWRRSWPQPDPAVAGDRHRQGPVVAVAPGEARLTLIVFAATPRREVVLQVLAGLAVLDLELDPVDAAGGARRSVDGELDAGLLDATLDRVGDRGLVGAWGRDAGEVVERDAADVLAALGRCVAAGDHAARRDEHGLVALERVRARAPLERLAVDRVDHTDVVADDDVVAEAVAREALATCRSPTLSRPGHGSLAVGDSIQVKWPPR